MAAPLVTRAPGKLLAAATILLLTAVWGTTWAAIRVMLEGIPPITGVALRFAIAGAVLALVSLVMGLPLRATSGRDRALRAGHAVLSFCISYGVVFWGEQWVPSGLAAVLFAIFPLFVVILAHWWLPEERMTRRSLVGCVIGFLGIATIFGEDLEILGGSMVVVAASVILLSPLCSAVASVAVKRWGEGVHPVPLNAAAMGWASLVMSVIAVLVEHDAVFRPDLPSVAAVLYMAIFGSALTFSLYFWLLQHMQARQLALIAYGTPVVALIVGAVFMDEPITQRTLAGSAMVVIGVAMASYARSKVTPPTPGRRG